MLSTCTLQAQEWPEVPARFVRVTSLSGVTRAGFYAIGASDTDGHYLMRQTPAVNYEGKQTVAAAGEQRDAEIAQGDDQRKQRQFPGAKTPQHPWRRWNCTRSRGVTAHAPPPLCGAA